MVKGLTQEHSLCEDHVLKTFALWISGEPECVQRNLEMYVWNGGVSVSGAHSIPDYVEAHADRLRGKYLSFIHEFGDYRIQGRSISDHLEVHGGYNLWWMSSLQEKSYMNSPRITDCIKLLALEEILSDRKPDAVVVHSEDRILADSVWALCACLNIPVSIKPYKQEERFFSWRNVIPVRPNPFSAILMLLRHIRSRWGLRKAKKPDWFSGNNAITFFSYFAHLDLRKCSEGAFYSGQWGPLPEMLTLCGLRLNWVHHFMNSQAVQDVKTGIDWIDRFNKDFTRQGKHAFFDSYLSVSIVLRAVFHYVRLLIKSLFFLKIPKAFKQEGSCVYFAHLLQEEWLASTRGSTAMRNLLFIELVDSAVRSLPKQTLGFYLQENQFWERALIHAWRRYGHGRIVGVPHSTMNFWDLRFYDDIRTLQSKERNGQERPDAVALNGPVALQNYLKADYPADELIEVEALRYLYLAGDRQTCLNRSSQQSGEKAPRNNMRVIILGDLKYDVTNKMLCCLQQAAQQSAPMDFAFKKHPACGADRDEWKAYNLNEVTRPLKEVLPDFDLAIATGSTSAVIEAFYSGKSIIVYLPENELNLSPVRGIKEVKFVRTACEMRDALESIYSHAVVPQDREFFWLDAKMPRWKKLMEDSGYLKIMNAYGAEGNGLR